MKIDLGKPDIRWLSAIMVPVLVALAIYLGVALFSGDRGAAGSLADRRMATEIATLTYPVATLAARAAAGEEQAFVELDHTIRRIEAAWSKMRAGSGSIAAAQLGKFDRNWQEVKTAAEGLLADRENILGAGRLARTLSETLPHLRDAYVGVAEVLLARSAPADQVFIAQAQSLRSERIARNFAKILTVDASTDSAALTEQIVRDVDLLGRVGTAMMSGDPSLGVTRVANQETQRSLAAIADLYRTGLTGSSGKITEAAPALARAQDAAQVIAARLPELLKSGAELYAAGTGLSALAVANRAVYASLALIAGLVLLGLVYYFATRARLRVATDASQANQQAILRLLDEIEGIGEGNLIVEATVTEDFTGAIADSINSTIAQLRELVSRIVETAENVSFSANETRATALQLCEASEHQAQEIAGASAAITEMAITIDQVSANAAESSVVAERSVSIANKGAEVVRNTIKGMDGIREQIQDTSKRIKRLGESSQQIGDIVSLINDIADQTNILALNAAIQAAMAGDAGRGFAVVADEVQRLAERSANATKQIAALVRTIQTDAMEAVSSMEQTTAEVVAGAALTQNAGVALGEIETVSTDLAELIQDISTVARHQSATAGHISKTMNVIQDITSQTLAGATNTASSVGYLAEMAVVLRESVSGFKLPVQPNGRSHVDALRPAKVKPAMIRDRSPAVDRLPSRQRPGGTAHLEDRHAAERCAAQSSSLDTRLADDDQLSSAAPPRLANVMAESSAAMTAIDRVAAEAIADEGVPAPAFSTGTARDDFERNLEAELAGINLDEFDLTDDEPQFRQPS